VVAQQYHYPYGANRGGAQSDLTERRYTGQYHETGLAGAEGLCYYNARWWRWPAANAKRIRGGCAADPPMTPALGRFIQADTIVPSPGNPQSLNRYAYVYDSPLKYADSSGRVPVPLITGGVGALVVSAVDLAQQLAWYCVACRISTGLRFAVPQPEASWRELRWGWLRPGRRCSGFHLSEAWEASPADRSGL